MEERSLRVDGTDKTFFNKLTKTLTKFLIPTQIGINGMRISMKRNALIKAYEATENIEDGQRIYLKVEAVDAEGNKADPIEIICIADKVAPEVYSQAAEFNEKERIVDIFWGSGQEEDLQGYYVYRKTENPERSSIRFL